MRYPKFEKVRIAEAFRALVVELDKPDPWAQRPREPKPIDLSGPIADSPYLRAQAEQRAKANVDE